jgi:hypothetical protein
LVLIATTDRQRGRVDPDAVAALDATRRFDPPEDRNACSLVGHLVQVRFSHSARLAHPENDRALVGDKRGVMGKHGIGESVTRILDPDDLGAA